MSRPLSRSSHRHSWIALGVMGAALTAALVPVVAAAQDPTLAPGTVQVVPVGPDGAQGGTVIVSGGTVGVGPDVVQFGPVGCATSQAVIVGTDGQTSVQSGPDVTCGVAGMGFGPPELGGVTIVGSGTVSGPGGPGMPGTAGTVTVMAEPAHLVTVMAVNGPTVSLKTDDGWSRDLDTTNVAITLDTDTLTAADLAVDDQVLVVQVRNANDTYTVTGLQLILPEVTGVVSDVTAGGFTVTAMDGTRTIIRVSDATTWPPVLPSGSATGLSALKDGDMVVARGKLAKDGSMDASSVAVPVTITVSSGGQGMMVVPPTEAPAPTPEASPKG